MFCIYSSYTVNLLNDNAVFQGLWEWFQNQNEATVFTKTQPFTVPTQ